MVVDSPRLVFTYIARKAAKQEWNSKKKKKKKTTTVITCENAPPSSYPQAGLT
jgi:hypothetical protein